ncbi:MAG: VWA domain-containing protein [Chloroflexi bacterium]|nr:VWA domain-containing protein [Chloroflexota bacterium]
MSLQFASPLALVLLLALPALVLWEVRRAGARPALRLSSLASAHAIAHTWRVRLRWTPAALRTLALALLIVALARPQSGEAEALVPQKGIDIVLALDTSSSMRSAPPRGDARLVVAQGVLRDFVANRENDRLGLVAFRSRSFVISPLTLDYRSFQQLVDQAGGVELEDGTAIGLAVADSLNLLRTSTARSRVIILLTDGEDNQPEVSPLTSARLAEALGIRLYTIGIMTPSGLSSPFGRPEVNEAALREMAELTGGRFFAATDPDALVQVYETIDSLERSRLGAERFAALDELAPYLLAAGLALLAAELLLRTSILRRMP